MESTEREAEALDLRRQGYTYNQIGEKMHISNTRVSQLVSRAMGRYARVMAEEAKTIREMQYSRLDDLLSKCYEIYTNTKSDGIKLECISKASTLVMYQAKLYGVDVTRIEIKAPWQELLADTVITVDVVEPPPPLTEGEMRAIQIESPDEGDDGQGWEE